jgi:hypothetical protein
VIGRANEAVVEGYRGDRKMSGADLDRIQRGAKIYSRGVK